MKVVDFGNYPIQTAQMNWMLKDSHTPTTGFSYTIGSGNGQHQNVNGITWADSSYFDSVLGTGGFSAVNSWNMKPLIVYTDQKNGNWLTNGWNYVQDMAEGATCVDDVGRAAVTLTADYLANGTEASYQSARDVLTFLSYMTTRQGKTYNFAWLDAPAIFGWDPIQAQDANFEYRSEYVKRTQYPSASPSSAWFDTNSDTAHIIGYPNSTNARRRSFRIPSIRSTWTTCAMHRATTSPKSTTARFTPPPAARRPATRPASRRPGRTARKPSAPTKPARSGDSPKV